METQKKMIQSYIFVIFLFVGMICSILCQKYLGGEWNVYLKELQTFPAMMEQTDTDFSSLFPYVIITRGKEILILCCFNLTNLAKWYQGWYGLRLGFMLTMLCGGCIKLYGVMGLILGIGFYFPHGILLFYLIYLSIHYFEHYRRCKADWKEWGKLISAMAGLFVLLCFLESTVNPWLLKKVMYYL